MGRDQSGRQIQGARGAAASGGARGPWVAPKRAPRFVRSGREAGGCNTSRGAAAVRAGRAAAADRAGPRRPSWPRGRAHPGWPPGTSLATGAGCASPRDRSAPASTPAAAQCPVCSGQGAAPARRLLSGGRPLPAPQGPAGNARRAPRPRGAHGSRGTSRWACACGVDRPHLGTLKWKDPGKRGGRRGPPKPRGKAPKGKQQRGPVTLSLDFSIYIHANPVHRLVSLVVLLWLLFTGCCLGTTSGLHLVLS